MAEKTESNIALLMLEMRDLAERIIECQGENAEGEEIINLYDESDTTFKAQSVLLLLNAFQVERQRAENMTASRDGMTDKRDAALAKVYELEAEILKLKGVQVPVFEIEVSGSHWLSCSTGQLIPRDDADFSSWPDGIVKLFAAQQMPTVVLPDGYKPHVVRYGDRSTSYRAAMTFGGDWLHRDAVVEAIEAVGGIVSKASSECL